MTLVSQVKSYAENPHLRFEEGASTPVNPRRSALLNNLSGYKIIVVVEDDRKQQSVVEEWREKFPKTEVAWVHAPIGLNRNVFLNGLFDELQSSKASYVVVVWDGKISTKEIEEAITVFDNAQKHHRTRIMARFNYVEKLKTCDEIKLPFVLIIAELETLFNVVLKQFGGAQ